MSLRAQLRGRAVEIAIGDRFRGIRRRIGRQIDRLRATPRRLLIAFAPADPYSYVLAQQLPALVATHELRVVPLLVKAGGTADPDREGPHAIADVRQLHRFYDFDFPRSGGAPEPGLVDEAYAILAAAAPESFLDTAQRVGRALFRADEAGLEQLSAELGRDADWRARRAADQRRLNVEGHYMSGTYKFEGEWFWGPDRVRHLARELGDPHRAARPGLELRPRPLPETSGRAVRLSVYFSFRSPYSYLCLPRVVELARRANVPLALKPVLPMVLRGFRVPLRKQLYIVRDSQREADYFGVPFGRLNDPLGGGVERCLAITAAARRDGRDVDFALHASRAIWAEAVDLHRNAELRRLVEHAGLQWEIAAQGMSECGWEQQVRAHRDELTELGLWGVPCFRVEAQDGSVRALWGQDRLDVLAEWLSDAERGVGDVV